MRGVVLVLGQLHIIIKTVPLSMPNPKNSASFNAQP